MIEYKILTSRTRAGALDKFEGILNSNDLKDGWRIVSTHVDNADEAYTTQLIIILERSVDYHS